SGGSRRLERHMLDDHNRCNADRKAGQRQHAAPPMLSRNLPRLSRLQSCSIQQHPPDRHRTHDILDHPLIPTSHSSEEATSKCSVTSLLVRNTSPATLIFPLTVILPVTLTLP